MKGNKIKIFAVILVVLTTFFAVLHLNGREEIPENALQINAGDKTCMVDIMKLNYEQVTGTRINGKGEELPVNASGILLGKILEQENIFGYCKVTVMADDSYKAEVTADEIYEDKKVYLLYEETSLRLVVFGDKDSKRSVSNVVQITVEY